MDLPGYILDIESTLDTIKENGFQCVVLQIPEGMKTHVHTLVKTIEQQTRAMVLVSADPCYGACDVFSSSSFPFSIDAVIHIGHTNIPCLPSDAIPVYFIAASSTMDVIPVIEKSVSQLSGKRVGVVTTAQHLHSLDEISEYLREKGFQPVLGKGDERIAESAQVLGCNFTATSSIVDQVDCFLFVGSGTFHALGLVLKTNKPVIAADPYTQTVQKEELDTFKETILRQRYGAIAKAKQSQSFGILIGKKNGQVRMNTAMQQREQLKKAGKQTMLLLIDHVSPEIIQSFRNIDCFVSTLCPRLAFDDYLRYDIPIITPIESDIALGLKSWDEYTFDEIIERD